MIITVDAYGSRLLIDGTEIGGFSRIGTADGMTIIMRLDADDPGQKALAAASVSAAPREFCIVFKDGARRRFLASVTTCEMDGENLCAVLQMEPGSIVKTHGKAEDPETAGLDAAA